MTNLPNKQKAHLTEEMLVEYKANFDSFDVDNSGKISVISIAPLMRKLGLMPSNIEIEEMVTDVDKEKNAIAEGITFEQFCEMAARKVNNVYSESEIIEAFRTFDVENNGFLTVDELRRALCTMGENLTDDEMEALIETAKPDQDGNVKYEEFVRNIMSDFQ